MSAVAEMLHPQEVITPDDLTLAELIELGATDLEALTITQVHYLGNIILPGEVDHPVIRTHCGPEGTTKRGGTKFKLYSSAEEWQQDAVDHGKAMREKIGAIDKTEYAGGKTIANIDPHPAGMSAEDQHTRLVSSLDQLAGLVIEAGLADPRIDGTAGDEGTNGEIGKAYLNGLRRRGVPNAEACVTGKPDMRTRPAATGRGAAISQRASMRHNGENYATIVTQGAGFAGAYYAAEAYQPYDSRDEDITLVNAALGDINPHTRRPATLTTSDAGGLPITRKMVNEVLDPTDRHVQATNGDKLVALAWKIEKKGVEVEIRDQDVLTFDPTGKWQNTYLAPAATSNVIRPDNIDQIVIKKWLEIGNHTVHHDLIEHLGELGIDFSPGELRNVAGVDMSIEENRRDLAKIAAAESGGLYLPTSDHVYEDRMRATMVDTTNRVHRVATEYGVSLRAATKMVSLGNYAIANNMHISSKMFSLLSL